MNFMKLKKCIFSIAIAATVVISAISSYHLANIRIENLIDTQTINVDEKNVEEDQNTAGLPDVTFLRKIVQFINIIRP